jgi:hypothetical protein
MFLLKSFPKKNLRWWFANKDRIDFDPDFQRKSTVWKGPDQAFLIDSILNGFDVPKLYIDDFTTHNVPELNTRGKSYAIIDGKQRLTAIVAFRQDKFALSSKFVLTSDPTRSLKGLKYGELKRNHPPVAALFDKYVLDVKSIETNEREKINEVFRRLNEASKALNGAENRNARIGKAVDAIRQISQHRFLTTRIRFDTSRSQEKNAAAKLLLLEFDGRSPKDTKKLQLDEFVVSIGAVGSGRFDRCVTRVSAQLDRLSEVFQNQDELLAAQGNIPLYYLFVSRLKAAERKKVRLFLLWFEKARRKNRNARLGDSDFDSYDINNRSTNDAGSYRERLRVIRKKHTEWKRVTENGSRPMRAS